MALTDHDQEEVRRRLLLTSEGSKWSTVAKLLFIDSDPTNAILKLDSSTARYYSALGGDPALYSSCDAGTRVLYSAAEIVSRPPPRRTLPLLVHGAPQGGMAGLVAAWFVGNEGLARHLLRARPRTVEDGLLLRTIGAALRSNPAELTANILELGPRYDSEMVKNRVGPWPFLYLTFMATLLIVVERGVISVDDVPDVPLFAHPWFIRWTFKRNQGAADGTPAKPATCPFPVA